MSSQHSQSTLWQGIWMPLAIVQPLDYVRIVFVVARDDLVGACRLLLARHGEIDDFADLVEGFTGPLFSFNQG